MCAHARQNLVAVLCKDSLNIFVYNDINRGYLERSVRFDCPKHNEDFNSQPKVNFYSDSIITTWVPGAGVSVYEIAMSKDQNTVIGSKVCHLSQPNLGEPLGYFGPSMPFRKPSWYTRTEMEHSSIDQLGQNDKIICVFHEEHKGVHFVVSTQG